MKRVVVTGASGFVGANIARRLLRDGHEVHLLLRKSHQSWRLQEIGAETHLHEVDIRDREEVARAVRLIKPDWIFHLAAYGAYPTQKGIDQMVATNLMGCVHLLDACAGIGFEAFVQAGSSSEYGFKCHPAQEADLVEPNSEYAVTKAAATHYCQFMACQRDINAITLRFYSIYGPYEEPNRLIPTLIVYGMDGRLPPLAAPETARDFVYVDDAVGAMILAASKSGIPRGAVYNVASQVQRRLADVVEVASRLLGIEVEPAWGSMEQRSWDTNTWVGSNAAIRRDLGWEPQFDFPAGLEQTLCWFREHPQWLRFYRSRIFGFSKHINTSFTTKA